MSKDFVIHDENWSNDLEKGVTEYTDSLIDTLFEEGESVTEQETLSGELFCGCSTCFWRETFFYLVPRLLEGYNEGKVGLIED